MLLTLIVRVSSEVQFVDRDNEDTTAFLCMEQGTVMAPWRNGLGWLLVGCTPSIQGQLFEVQNTQVAVHICDFYPALEEGAEDIIMVGYVERIDRSPPW